MQPRTWAARVSSARCAPLKASVGVRPGDRSLCAPPRRPLSVLYMRARRTSSCAGCHCSCLSLSLPRLSLSAFHFVRLSLSAGSLCLTQRFSLALCTSCSGGDVACRRCQTGTHTSTHPNDLWVVIGVTSKPKSQLSCDRLTTSTVPLVSAERARSWSQHGRSY